ncbi:MAG: nitrous oxide reductase accessory protein NosL [Desulfobacterales bacterium]
MTGIAAAGGCPLSRRAMLKQTALLAAGVFFGGPGGLWAGAPAGRGPQPGALPLDEGHQMRISPEDRCPLCAMKVIKYPRFSCAIQLADGRTFYFCSAGCLIRSWLHPDYFLGVPADTLRRVVVREYFSGEQLDAVALRWVAGSDVVGPMGPAVVALRDDPRFLEAFQRRHGGTASFRLAELTDAQWQTLTGRSALPAEP